MLEQRAFEPEFLSKLDGLLLGVRRARQCVRAAVRSGRVQGGGIEPENFREYTAGDDLRYLDWNAFARLDDLTIRTFRADRQVEATVLVDASASMGVPARDDKLGLALLLGLGLAYVAMSENDPVRVVAIRGDRGGPRLIASRFSTPAARSLITSFARSSPRSRPVATPGSPRRSLSCSASAARRVS